MEDRSGNFLTSLRLLEDEEGRLQYQWALAPPLAPEVPGRDVNYGQYRSEQVLEWSERDWSRGALQFYVDPRFPGRYAIADGVWTLTPNELSLGPAPRDVTFGTRNGASQLKATTNWSVSGVTLTSVTTAPHTGEYHFQGAAWSTNNFCELSIVQMEQPAARWQSQAITVLARVRDSSGAAATVRMQIVESGGAATPTTSGTGVSLSTSYQTISAAVTLQADSTGVVLRIEMTADGGSDRTVYFDSVQCLPGSIVPNASNCQIKQLGTDLICVSDRAVWAFDDTGDYWALQHVHGAVITGFEVFVNRLIVGQGTGTAYEFSDAGDATTWTAASGGSGTQNFATRLVKGLNASGVWALAKSASDSDIHFTTDPTTATAWGSALTVGSSDFDLLQLYQLDGQIGVAKQDGFYRYLAPTNDQFANVYPGAEHMPSEDNFSRGIMFNGLFYTVLGETGLLSYFFSTQTGHRWFDLDHIIRSPGFEEFGNRVRAFGTDGHWLYLLIEDLNADSLTKKCWIFAIEVHDSEHVIHTIASITLSDGLDIFVHKPSGATNRFLYVMGDINNEAYCYRFQLPDRTDSPRLATNKELALSGTIITSWMDWNRPNVRKAAEKVTCISENLNGNRTITIAYEVDNETSFTNINTSATLQNSPLQAITFTEGITGRRIRKRYSFATDDSTDGPILKSQVFEGSWRPPRLRQWDMIGALEEGIRNPSGVGMPLAPVHILSNLEVLRKETSAITLRDLDNVSFPCHIIEMREIQHRVSSNQGSGRYARAIQLTLLQNAILVGEPWGETYWGQFNWG